jgi:hypothetical protein
MQVRAREGFEKAAQASSRGKFPLSFSFDAVRCQLFGVCCGCVGCVWHVWRALVGGFRDFGGCARHKAQRALLFHGDCLFSVEERERWRVWECVGDVVVCIGDVLGRVVHNGRGEYRWRWVDVGLHTSEVGRRDAVMCSFIAFTL